jgi:hypothetical protein
MNVENIGYLSAVVVVLSSVVLHILGRGMSIRLGIELIGVGYFHVLMWGLVGGTMEILVSVTLHR